MKLELDEKTAKEIFPGASEGLKAILIKSFGGDCFRKKQYTDFRTFDDLCQAIGTTEADFNKKWDPAVFDPSTIAFERIKVLTRAYNQDWKYNLYDTKQYKWFPVFEVLSSGLGFSNSSYYYVLTAATVGSRLCFESEEKSSHAGKTFLKLFEDFISAIY